MSIRGRWTGLVAGLLSAAFLVSVGCSPETNTGGTGGGTSQTGSAGAGGESGAAGGIYTGGSGGFSGGGFSGSAGGIDIGGENTDFDPDKVCAGKKVDPVPVEKEVETLVPYEVIVPKPIAIYIMLDKSGSMDQGDPSKWSIATDAITTFVNDPASEFIDVALQFFPHTDMACDGVAYTTPAVPMGPLPGNAGAITAALAAPPGGGMMTPIEPALRGMTAFCANFQAQNPDEQCVGVFISDGAPTACNGDPNLLVGIGQSAYDTSDVKTFTVGMQGADFNLLNQIAMWSGSDCTPADTTTYACDVSTGMTLLEAFESIREFVTELEERTEFRTEITTKISECDWGIPVVPEGETFNKDMVNVVFYEPGTEAADFGRVASKDACGNLQGAWYYDDPDNPTTVISCDAGCEYIKGVEGASIDIQFGCETIILVE